MKSVSAGLAAHLAGDLTTLATCWKVKRTDGTVLGFTDHDADLAFDLGDGDGMVTYLAASGYLRTAIASSNALDVDNLEVEGILASATITDTDLRAGRYDSAQVKVFLVNWANLSDGALALKGGTIGEVTVTAPGGFRSELRGMVQAYAQGSVTETYTPDCRADLGDARCGVRLDPPAWAATTAVTVRQAQDAGTGSVVKPSVYNDRHFRCSTAGTTGANEPAWNTTLAGVTNDGSAVWTAIRARTVIATVATVTDRRTFTLAYAGDAPDAFLTGGLLTFTSGANAGIKREVKTWGLTSKTVTLFLDAPLAVQAGDGLTISAGCDKSLAVCRDTFDNVFAFRGEPHVPGNDLLFRTPNARA